ncbi:MAG: hypothetical protein KIT84_12425 [Labilithrix sp.]|nr:hypothetical protein [Labilithrix sp.]MCW5811819.1 hypothetical protein [Labilithrix sp.]
MFAARRERRREPMSDLSRWSRDLIDSARGEGGPSAEAKSRVRDAVLRAAAGPPPDTSPANTAAAKGLAVKAILPAALALAIGGGWLATHSEDAPPNTSAVASSASSSRAATAPPPSSAEAPSHEHAEGTNGGAMAASSGASGGAAAASSGGAAASSGAMATSTGASGGAATAASGASGGAAASSGGSGGVAAASSGASGVGASSGASASGSGLEEEVRLIREAQAALQRGDAAGARRSLDEHARRFPSGMLALERRGLRAIALCQEGAPDAEREARAFVASNGGAPIAARVRATCGLDP